MTPAEDLASYLWPPLTSPPCPAHLAGGNLICRGDRGHTGGHHYIASSADDGTS